LSHRRYFPDDAKCLQGAYTARRSVGEAPSIGAPDRAEGTITYGSQSKMVTARFTGLWIRWGDLAATGSAGPSGLWPALRSLRQSSHARRRGTWTACLAGCWGRRPELVSHPRRCAWPPTWPTTLSAALKSSAFGWSYTILFRSAVHGFIS